MIALGVELVRLLQHIAGTVFHAETATFASLLQDVDATTRDLYLLDIQWLSPILHFILLLPVDPKLLRRTLVIQANQNYLCIERTKRGNPETLPR
jgi:hypothetical protein